jgi:segregation and condensation protein B
VSTGQPRSLPSQCDGARRNWPLVASRGTTLAALARALEISIPAVREGLLRIADRLAAAGVRAVEDGAEVGLVPLPFAARAVAALTPFEPTYELSEEQAAILCIVAYHGAATRRDVERLRGEDSETLLRRLVERGLLHKAADEASPGGPNVYRVTTRALAATGHATLESLQAYLTQAVDARGAIALSAQGMGTTDADGVLAGVG